MTVTRLKKKGVWFQELSVLLQRRRAVNDRGHDHAVQLPHITPIRRYVVTPCVEAHLRLAMWTGKAKRHGTLRLDCKPREEYLHLVHLLD